MWIYQACQHIIISGDAGDGKQHFRLGTAAGVINGTNSADLRISYVNCGKKGIGFYFNGVDKLEIDHCYLYKVTNKNADSASFISNTDGPRVFDRNRVHDNAIYIPRSTTTDGWGDDGFDGDWVGVSFYNNIVIGYDEPNYLAGQHQDGSQILSGSYVKYYGNYFQTLSNYAIYLDAVHGGFSNVYVYNNIISMTDPSVQKMNSPGGIAIGPEGNFNFSTVIVANNLVADYGAHHAMSLYNPAPGSRRASFTNCKMVNNICLNSAGPITDPAVLTVANIVAEMPNGTGHFVNYTPLSATNDYHLVTTDRRFKDHGLSMAPYFTTDKDGRARPQGPAWDIGPYEYNDQGFPREKWEKNAPHLARHKGHIRFCDTTVRRRASIKTQIPKLPCRLALLPTETSPFGLKPTAHLSFI